MSGVRLRSEGDLYGVRRNDQGVDESVDKLNRGGVCGLRRNIHITDWDRPEGRGEHTTTGDTTSEPKRGPPRVHSRIDEGVTVVTGVFLQPGKDLHEIVPEIRNTLGTPVEEIKGDPREGGGADTVTERVTTKPKRRLPGVQPRTGEDVETRYIVRPRESLHGFSRDDSEEGAVDIATTIGTFEPKRGLPVGHPGTEEGVDIVMVGPRGRLPGPDHEVLGNMDEVPSRRRRSILTVDPNDPRREEGVVTATATSVFRLGKGLPGVDRKVLRTTVVGVDTVTGEVLQPRRGLSGVDLGGVRDVGRTENIVTGRGSDFRLGKVRPKVNVEVEV